MNATKPVFNFPIFLTSFSGLNTAQNVLTLSEGANTAASNVVFTYNNIITPRHGLPPWEVWLVNDSGTKQNTPFGIGPSLLITTAISANTITYTANGLATNQQVTFMSQGTALPGGITAGTLYYVRPQTANTFKLSTTPDNTGLITITSGTFNFRLILDENYINLFYWRTLVSETYIASLKQGDGTYSFVEIKPQDYTNPLSFAGYHALTTNGSTTYTIADPDLPLSSFKFPRYLQTNNGLYATTPTGLQVIRESAYPNSIMAPAAIPNAVVVTATFSNDTANNWFPDNTGVTFIALVVRKLTGDIETEGFPSNKFEILNRTGRDSILTVTVRSNPGETVRIYRTKHYNLSNTTTNAKGIPSTVNAEAPPTTYLQACGDVIVDGITGLGKVDILFNDSVIGASGISVALYTGTDRYGATAAYNQPPICSDAAEFKGHAFYADVLTQPTGKLEILSLDASTNPVTSALNGNNITIGTQTFTFAKRDFKTTYDPTLTTLPYEVNPSPYLGDTSLVRYGTGYGYFNKELGYIAPGVSTITEPPTNMRVTVIPYDPSTQLGDALPNGTSKNSATALVYDGITTLKVLGDFTKGFDITKFATPGMVIMTDVLTATNCSIFSYTGVAIDTATADYIDFTGYSFICGTAIAAGNTSGTFLFWYIPGTNLKDIPLYLGSGKIQADSVTNGSDTYGIVTRPAYLTPVIPLQRFNQPIAVMSFASTASNITISGVTTEFINADPVMLGASDRSMTELTDVSAQNLARWINTNSNTRLSYFALSDPNFTNSLIITALNFASINVSTDANIGQKFNPTLSTTPVDLSTFSTPRIKNGLVGSALGFPEQVPLARTTVNVGQSSNRIIKLAATKDDLFCFKEREGVFRAVIAQGTVANPIPQIQQVLPTDLTAIPIASESVQVVDDQVYFLTDRGFCLITNQQVQFISAAIEQDVKTATARTPSFDGIRAFVDRVKHIYVCTFPMTNADGTGTTFVFNSKTGMWSTFTTSFDWVVTDVVGRQTSLTNDYLIEGSQVVSTKQLNASNYDPRQVRIWQYLRQEVFTGQETENVYDNEFNQVVDNFGNNVVIQIGTFNIVDSSFDQFDEFISTFTSASISANGYITLMRDKTVYPHIPGAYFAEFVNRIRNEQLYYQTAVNSVGAVLVPVTITANPLTPLVPAITDTPTLSTITLLPLTANQLIAPSATLDSLMVGVNTKLDFVPFHNSTPETLKSFSKFFCHYQDRPEANSLPSTIYLSFAVDNQQDFSAQTIFNTVVANRTAYETLVPLVATRGRFLRSRIEHNQPLEYFQLNGLSFVYRETGSTRVSTR